MSMDIIYKHETNFDDENNFSIDLSSNNEIQNMIFKGGYEWLATDLKIKIKTLEETEEYEQVKKVSDLIYKLKNEKAKHNNSRKNTHKATKFY